MNARIAAIVEAVTGEGLGLVFYTGGKTSATERLRINKDGNVGIGTTGPLANLDVVGEDTAIYVRDNSTNTRLRMFASNSYASISTLTDHDLYFLTNWTNRIIIKNTGNVGIGTTGPEGLLELSKGHNAAGSGGQPQLVFDFYDGGTFPHYISTRHNSADSSNAIDFYVNTGSGGISNVRHVMSLVSGNVGIGTTAPTSKLQVESGNFHVNGSGSSAGLFYNSTSGNLGIGTTNPLTQLHATGIIYSENEVRAPILRTYNGELDSAATLKTYVYNGASYVERMRIDATSGNVGIGTINPTQKLEVSNSTQGLTISPNGGYGSGPVINSTGNTNVTIMSSGGSVIVRLG